MKDLIEKLADKTLSFGCEIGKYIRPETDRWRIIGKGIYNDKIGTEWITVQTFDGLCQSQILVKELNRYKILGYPILIGDVLDKIMSTDSTPETDGELVELWRACGFTRSLQEIMEDTELECIIKKEFHREGCAGRQLKPEAKSLMNFLNEIFND